jgi:hypothetical protein
MKVLILKACAVVCNNKPQSTISDNYNRMNFNATDDRHNSADQKNEGDENPQSKKMMHEFVDFSGGMLGI